MRNTFIQKLAKQLENLHPERRLLVAIDGIDTSGKTSFSNELKTAITSRPVFQLRLDHFHNPKAIRIKRGSLSPEGYYYDSFNYEFIIEKVLKPLQSGEENITTQLFDYKEEHEMPPEIMKIPDNAVILFDGVFMLRKLLRDYWDYSIFLKISFDEALNRGLRRDIHHFKDQHQLIERYNKRYLPGQSLYLSEEQPETVADVVIDHNDFLSPRIIRFKEEQ